MKIVQVVNAMISNRDKISKVIKDSSEFYFLYDNKYKWSIGKTDNESYWINFYPLDDVTIEDLSSKMSWDNYKEYVTYSTRDLKAREALESFKELYQVLYDKLYGIDNIFDDIIGEEW